MSSWVRFYSLPICAIWLTFDIFLLGYGDPSAPNTKRRIYDVDFNDTFLSLDHLKECFPEYEVQVRPEHGADSSPPYRVKIPQDENDKTLIVQPYIPPNRGPYP